MSQIVQELVRDAGTNTDLLVAAGEDFLGRLRSYKACEGPSHAKKRRREIYRQTIQAMQRQGYLPMGSPWLLWLIRPLVMRILSRMLSKLFNRFFNANGSNQGGAVGLSGGSAE